MQRTARLAPLLLGLALLPAFAPAVGRAADLDGDGVDDTVDNCSETSNPAQADSNGDGFGNQCDFDLNNNGTVDSQDGAMLRASFGSFTYADADFNGNGVVDSGDGAKLRAGLGQEPGPSGVNPPEGDVLFPLRAVAGTRHLLDASGRPFLMNGDTAWSIIVQLTLLEAETYLEDRRQKGANAILVNLLEHQFADNAPNNRAGQGPFTTPGDYATPNAAYFNHARAVIQAAEERGILVLLTPSYMGYGGDGEGWYQEMQANGATKLRNYGRYLGTQFAGLDNIVWVHGGDHDPPANPGLTLARAIVEGLQERDPNGRWLHTWHADRTTGAGESVARNEPWLNLFNIYTSSTDVVAEAFTEYAAAARPSFLIEGRYEDRGGNGPFIRLQAYHALLSGISGHLIGNDPMWYFGAGWQSYLDSDGARSLPVMGALFNSRQWWLLQPDRNATFMTGGIGSGEQRAVAALASDRTFALAYTPENRALTFNLARLAGPTVGARWFDPANGVYTGIAGSPFAASGSRTFTPPARNSQNARDWVLVLD